ncbi:uncharacterized protein LOC108586766 isoform X2 [Papio anubis]|uniref:uncharacterized protein LOC108586766 isoform X2 n=1 Tax=Papio anubis TaxID=9555 RepID=UPI0012AD279E|nr:uncharacterized protein LOC108586766 isoform X2 [Papio anubis]
MSAHQAPLKGAGEHREVGHGSSLGSGLKSGSTLPGRCSNRAPEQDWRQSEKDQWEQLAAGGRGPSWPTIFGQCWRPFRSKPLCCRGESMSWDSAGPKAETSSQQVECSLACLEQERHQRQGSQGQAEWRRPDQDIEDNTLQVPEVPVPLRKQLEAQESHPRLHEEMAEYWRTRWHQVAVALKFKEEELQRLQRQSGTWPPQDRRFIISTGCHFCQKSPRIPASPATACCFHLKCLWAWFCSSSLSSLLDASF